MSDNPKVTTGNVIPASGLPVIERLTYEMINFNDRDFKIYAPDVDPDNIPSEFTPDSSTVSYFWDVGHAYNETGENRPDFVSPNMWYQDDGSPAGLQLSASGFATALNSIMPKIIIPSLGLVDNGLVDSYAMKLKITDTDQEGIKGKDAFNWRVVKLLNTDFDPEHPIGGWQDEYEVAGSPGKYHISLKAKDDSDATKNVNVLKLEEQEDPPKGDWQPIELVGKGAFCLMLNIAPIVVGKRKPEEGETKWSVKITFGEVTMLLNDSGALSVQIGTGDDASITKCQLSDAQAKEMPPQAKTFEKPPYIICICPVWNGIIISNGIQDVRNGIKISSQFCVKNKKADMSKADWQLRGKGGDPGAFQSSDPKDIFIKSNSSTTVDFGTVINVECTHCRGELAYLPIYFGNAAIIDSYFIAQKDQPADSAQGIQATKYSYGVYTKWTDNGSGYGIQVQNLKLKDIDEETEWRYIRLKFRNSKPARNTGEVFGFLLRTSETKQVTTRTGNGSFNLQWTGGSPAGPKHTHWADYIKSVNIQIGMDGSSGSIVVDKYGLAGQEAAIKQSIGALHLDVQGPTGTRGGRLWSGLGYGIADAKSSDGADWTIQLRGLETKMSEIFLINVPFFDGEPFYKVVNILSGYCGIVPVYNYASPGYTLTASVDPTTPLIDFRTGTPVQDAMNTTMELSAHAYVVQADGYIYFYQLGADGLPLYYPGTDWKPQYPGTKMVSYDTTPDFEDIRNEILVMGQKVIENVTRDTNIRDLPLLPVIRLFPMYNTKPVFPWSKSMIYGVPGYIDEDTIDNEIWPKIRTLTRVYALSGSVQIPGNANIRIYDAWGDLRITSISHSVNLQEKTWTTSLELAEGSAFQG